MAFEVDSDGLPTIPVGGQHVFAYLPVQRIPFLPFLINANFVLTANREGVPETDWNEALRNGVSSAFVGLVMEVVASGDPLEFKWMRFCPEGPMQGFWQNLWGDIWDSLKYKSVLRSRRDQLHDFRHIRTLPGWFIHDGKPLVADTDQDIYLSEDYEPNDVRILKYLGVEEISPVQILQSIRLGLSTNAETPIHDIPLDDSWHTAFAALVQRLLRKENVKNEVRQLQIIPLDDGTWVSPSSLLLDAVYLPYLVDEDSVSIEVPDGLGFQKLHLMAAADGERASFYTSLGITSCRPDAVTTRILEMHQSWERNGTFLTFKRDLEILFWFGKRPSLLTRSQDRLCLVSDRNQLHRGRFLFFPSEDYYNSERLLAATPKEDWNGYGILDKRYLESQVSNHIRYGLDWRSYLQKWGVEYFPCLAQEVSTGWKLHPLMVLIARDNPNSFVANLKAHWSDYRVDAPRIKNDLKNVRVPCLNGSAQPLCDTILPTHILTEKSRDPNLTNLLPFLKLPADYDPQQPDAWVFLKEFGVICEVNTNFYLRAIHLLANLVEANLIPTCANIYGGIAQTTAVGDANVVQQEFATRPLIRSRTTREAWYRSTDCIWKGPGFLRVKQELSSLYGADPSASSFFKTILNMRNFSYDDLIDELKMLSTEATARSPPIDDKVQKIYTALAGMASSEPAIEAIRKEFNINGLIYVSRQWLKPTECLWNCTVAISGRVPLDRVYPQLKEFFVNKMKVMTMNINVLLQELGRTAKKTSPDTDEVKRIMLAMGELLASDCEVEINEEKLRSLRQTAFLPVRGPGGLRLFSLDQAFAINDHQRYGQLFQNKAKIVDFGHEEMTSLHPLFELLGLEGCYLSNLVRPDTTVDQSTPNQALENHIRDRAYALSCCANYYNSWKYYNRNTSMHELLLNTEVFVCEEMWTELVLLEEDDSVTVRSDRAVVDVRHSDGRLAIYVPSDHDGLYSCFHTELPENLAGLLGIENERAVKVIYRILNDNNKDLDAIMKDEDLPEYQWFERPTPSLQAVPFPVPDDTEPGSSRPTPTSSADTSSNSDDNVVVIRADQSGTAAHSRVENSLPSPVHVRPTGQHSIWEEVARDEQYKRLLREVIRQARRGRSPRRRESLSLDEIDEALNDLDHPADYAAFRRTFGVAGYGNFEENARVGAAGELYVFELLKACGVTNFSIDNWQSSIRHYVNVLPEYATEPSWYGREVSDIMYKGNCPRLMDMLRRNTTFPYPAWLESGTSTPVNYHVEVKTTSGPCSTPFFMSSQQYRLMRDKACPPDSTTAPRDLYLIMRVYNLFSSRIGLQVYINPWHLKDRALEFVADPWKVIPM
ncbi:hypothetical protein, variant [Phialophora macrospora]|uniref:Protein NO VEIN C-terminal domain-containing protein n=1 Tax=Phialophora macrospora TaxID=1851006 RepID=A0A0D2G0A0_9EURO|nr:hypothetical protein, variant [Phialophora macrospora]